MLRFPIVNPAAAFARGGASIADREPIMSDVVQRSLRALIAEHGDVLFARPALGEQLLREAAPGQDEAVSIVMAALVDGVPARLVPPFDAAATEFPWDEGQPSADGPPSAEAGHSL
jgi:hypothetical protein